MAVGGEALLGAVHAVHAVQSGPRKGDAVGRIELVDEARLGGQATAERAGEDRAELAAGTVLLVA
ncbi:hypothetical protein D3C72_1364620 [compost metagenome]